MEKTSDNEKKFKGLCVNCDHRETCTFTKPEDGVLSCEEYACTTKKSEERVPPQLKPETMPKDEKDFKGLCVNCDYRETCTFTKPKDGVLSCREYACTTKKKLKGLCVNCDHRETCTFTKPKDGVWFCEEYC